MLERNEVERALDWRKGLAARERKARWRGEEKLLKVAVSRSLSRKRPIAAFIEPAAIDDLFNPKRTEAHVDYGRPCLPSNPTEWATRDSAAKTRG